MRTLILTLAATTLLAGPSLAGPGNGYGHDPKVCLVTFESEAAAMSQADAGVTKAQYVPLSIAVKLEMRSDSTSDIYTYGADGYMGPEVDHHYAGDTTENTCTYLDNIGGGDDSDD